jgi:fatty acid desaturase
VRPLRRPVPPPLRIDGLRIVGVGTALWVVALLGLLPFYGWLVEANRVWWLWTCLAGTGLGLLGMEYCRRRRARGGG